MKTSRGLYLFILASLTVVLLVSCGSPTASHTIGGTVINLAGTGGGLMLQNNGGDTLSVNANGTFTFPTKLASGKAYNVTIFVQPSAPAQTCGVTNGTGTATDNVTSVAVDCAHNEWTWMSGSNILNQQGTYGTKGAPAPDNIPGARYGAVSWKDAAGNFWLFGGSGIASGWTWDSLNDLWKYSAGEWTWMSGSNIGNQLGTYGTEGTPAADNVPGARFGAVSWKDAAGNFWLFGGNGYDSAGTTGLLNDLWKYSTGEWTWMSGSNTGNQLGTYGTKGTPAPDNVPGARYRAVTWTDTAGNLWLFGGEGYDSAGRGGYLNDLWKYSAGEWTWMSGSNSVWQLGTYGIKGTPAPDNVPGSRADAVSWIDASGNLWLFGGYGLATGGAPGELNDLWKYSAGEWTWMSGSNITNQWGTYGTKGMPAPDNVPGARVWSVSWTDAAGNLWLFGGAALDTGVLNDLWKYSAGEWTWMTGSNWVNGSATYGTKGSPAPGNDPGARSSGVTWTDAAGNLWLFGGGPAAEGGVNDLWKYEP